MHGAAYQAVGLNLTYRAVRVPASEFDEAAARLSALGYRGVNITVPLKSHAYRWALERGGLAGEDLGALPGVSVNTLNLRTQQGISTDEPGFLALMKEAWPKGKARILILGAGGTAFALAPRLAAEGHSISVWNRTPGKWEPFLERQVTEARVISEIDLAGIDVVLNCTSAGLSGQSLPISWDAAAPYVSAIDLVYGQETPFLAGARARGLCCLDGTLMLVEQGALSFEWWLGIPAPRRDMLEAVSHGDS
jgi:shikimate dehydrogenase